RRTGRRARGRRRCGCRCSRRPRSRRSSRWWCCRGSRRRTRSPRRGSGTPRSAAASPRASPPVPLQLAGQGEQGRLAERPERAEGLVDGGGLVPAVHHAVPALLVPALAPVALPLGGLHQLAEGLGVALLEQIARALPPEDVEGGVAPRGALVVVLAHQEAEE